MTIPPEPAVGRLAELVIDVDDPTRVVPFWCGVLGTVVERRGGDWIDLAAVSGGVRLAFQVVPEPKTFKNRLHLDLAVDDLVGAAERVRALGGRTLGDVRTEADSSAFVVCADPAGNEFCLVRYAGA